MNKLPPTIGNHYQIVAQTIEFIRSHKQEQPTLQQIAKAVGLSEYHLQRVFSEWAGISPKRFLQFLTKEYALNQLRQADQDVLGVALDSGLSGAGRLHDLMVTCEAMTPGEIKAMGAGLVIGFGESGTPFGHALIGWTGRGICYLAFCDHDCEARFAELTAQWPEASRHRDDQGAMDWCSRIFGNKPPQRPLRLLVRGTNFQLKVWQALLEVGRSQLVSYSHLAQMAGSPRAQRAVGSAMAANAIAYLIPCHRVIRGDGVVGQYRWGSERKTAIQVWEAGQSEKAG